MHTVVSRDKIMTAEKYIKQEIEIVFRKWAARGDPYAIFPALLDTDLNHILKTIDFVKTNPELYES